ncbi:hypothetical protein [Streptomyces lateritius]|uniref:hypothetical protein n=1 Tax=Streptomyces lateritius TaxID=67313 RepID=UPI001C8BB594|nr:hypothetical protein [Streptomyces lateritius]MBX9422067.1 hypothetical protein [Streptomyces lateritius]
MWPSQRTALDAGLLDARAHNLTVTMPTSAGKTHIAEWAILHALSDTGEADESPFGLCLRYMDPSLAVYVVPESLDHPRTLRTRKVRRKRGMQKFPLERHEVLGTVAPAQVPEEVSAADRSWHRGGRSVSSSPVSRP